MIIGYAIMSGVQMIVVCLIMVFGWGLQPIAWWRVIVGYIILSFAWPFMVWTRITLIKKWEGLKNDEFCRK